MGWFMMLGCVSTYAFVCIVEAGNYHIAHNKNRKHSLPDHVLQEYVGFSRLSVFYSLAKGIFDLLF